MVRAGHSLLVVLLSLGVSTTAVGQTNKKTTASKPTAAKRTTRSTAPQRATTTRQTAAQRAARARAAAMAREMADTVIPRYKVDASGDLVPDVHAAAAIVYDPVTNQVLF